MRQHDNSNPRGVTPEKPSKDMIQRIQQIGRIRVQVMRKHGFGNEPSEYDHWEYIQAYRHAMKIAERYYAIFGIIGE